MKVNMKNFSQAQVAVIVAMCLALGTAIPSDLPRWDGSSIEAFNATKQLATTTFQKGQK